MAVLKGKRMHASTIPQYNGESHGMTAASLPGLHHPCTYFIQPPLPDSVPLHVLS